MPNRGLRSLAAGAVLTAAAWLPAWAQNPVVEIRTTTFEPAFIEIALNTEVEWRQPQSTTGHTVTTQPGAPDAFDSHPNCQTTTGLNCTRQGDVYRFRFTRAGVYNYYCKAHGAAQPSPDPGRPSGTPQPCGMCGRVTVRAQQQATAAPTPTATRPGTTAGPARTASPAPGSSPTPTPAPTTPGETATPSPEPTGTIEAGASPGPRDTGGGTGRAVAIGVAAILAGAASYIGYLRLRAR